MVNRSRDDVVRFARDRARLDTVRAARADAAATYSESVASRWERSRDLHVSDDLGDPTSTDAVAERPANELSTAATRTRRAHELLAPRVTHRQA